MDALAENSYLILILSPLVGSFINGVFGKRFSAKLIAWIACAAVGISFLAALLIFLEVLQFPMEERTITRPLFTWIQSGDFVANFSLLFDPLSLVMILMVTGVGFIIHVYSAEYMAGDPGYYRYFSYLNLFIFMMSLLVLADNYLLMFIGWEGVGLCSYLLIGYYFERKSAGDAGKKAFIVNRIGDVGFVLAVLLIFQTFGSVEYLTVFQKVADRFPAPDTEFGVLGAITLLLFLGATGKSAQIPLYVWLPDAMEGPTPVSALIHAATMVTAGVYMIARSAALYSRAPEVSLLVAVIGSITALLAATIAIAQRDIKRVLAYSTISQLGYMFLAVGVGAFAAGIFHLVTHAFFKALLFLGAGSVILALHHEMDLFRMGGMKRYLRWTWGTMLIATLAITGIPPFAGFFSKDEILWEAFSAGEGHWVLWAIGIGVAALTAFYMFRMFFLAFHGSPPPGAHAHAPKEPSAIVIVPLAILALFSVIAGFLGLPEYLGTNLLDGFLEPSFRYRHVPSHVAGHAPELEYLLLGAAIVAALVGIGIAYWSYVKDRALPDRLAGRFSALYQLVWRRFLVDELYDAVLVRPIHRISKSFLWQGIDVGVIDGLVNGTASTMLAWGHVLKKIQSGYARIYAGWILFGAVLIVLYYYLVSA